MKRAAFQMRVVFHFFEPVRCVRALFVTRGDVAGYGFPLRFRLGAFDHDEFSGHNSLVLCLWFGGCFLGFLGFLFAFAVGETE